MSGDTAGNAGPNSFQVQPGAVYSERECDPRSIPAGAYPGEARPYPGSDPYSSDPRPYPAAIPFDRRDPFPPTGIRDPYPPTVRDPYPITRDPYPVRDRFPATSRDPYPTRDANRDREFYPARDRDHTFGRDPYPNNRDQSYYRDPPYTSSRIPFPPTRDRIDTYPPRDRDPYPPSTYPGVQEQGNYLDPDLSPHRCRHTVTYEKVVGYTYNGARK